MRGRQDAGSNVDILGILTQLDDSLNDLRATLSTQERGLGNFGRQLEELQRVSGDLRNVVEGIEGTVSAETRILREELANQSHRIDSLDFKLGQLESIQTSLQNAVEERLRKLSAEVTLAVGGMIIVVAVVMVLMLLIR